MEKLQQANKNIEILISNFCINKREQIKNSCPCLNNDYFFPDKEKYIAYCDNKQCTECKNEYIREYKNSLLKLYIVD